MPAGTLLAAFFDEWMIVVSMSSVAIFCGLRHRRS
jgi:hypothetical protein